MTNTSTERREFGFLWQRGRIWWLRYRVNGQEHRESSHSTSKREAEKLLNKRQAELSVGILTAADTKRVTFPDLAEMVRNDYKIRAPALAGPAGAESRAPLRLLRQLPGAVYYQRPRG